MGELAPEGRQGPAASAGLSAGDATKDRIDRKISPHKLRHRYAANLLNVGAELVDSQALLGHSTLNTTPIDAHVDQDRMAVW